MNIALIGATGRAGSEILKELVRRGHHVTAIVRNPEKVPAGANVTAKKGDVFDKAGLTELLKGMTLSSALCISPQAIRRFSSTP
jgi:putative NADH-flavin reductase